MGDFFNIITVDDIVTAMFFALVITYILKRLLKAYRFVGITGDVRVNYDIRNFKEILKRCYDLFPKDVITFNGITYRRGMFVEILTHNNKIIKGEIVGLNKDNLLCVITTNHIIAQEMSQISEITRLVAEEDAE